MANKSKVAGTAQETKICNIINDWAGMKVAERVPLHGSDDQGDIRIRVDSLTLVGESKYSKHYPSDGKLKDFKLQTVTENENAGGDGGILFVNLPHRSVNRMECHMQKSTLLRLHGIDLLVENERIPEDLRERLRKALFDDGEFDWVCITLFAFMNIAFGSKPAWEDRRG